jgi:redox-sensitive bicupin YhaK (pirin superfamily)
VPDVFSPKLQENQMITLRKAADRGHAEHGWLHSHHTFSFAEYHDPKEMGWGPLRVINDDTVEPRKGFGTHGHQDMEIISYVLDGALAHKDSMGTGSVIRPGEVQVMSAGTGVRHSEFNGSDSELVHFLQIWIVPKFTGVKPSYQQTFFDPAERRGKLRLLASNDGRDGSLKLWQDVDLYGAFIDGDEQIDYRVPRGRRAYVHVARGEVTLNGQRLGTGDGARIADESALAFSQGKGAEILLFDLN